jgi:prepilin-type N-terminal cleavage/methylation domain-containing protein
MRGKRTTRGFSMTELLVSMAIGSIVVGGAVQMFSQAMRAHFITSQKAELQQDFRAATNIMTRDISLAGSGIGDIGIALPSGTGTLPVYPCSAVACNYVNAGSAAYPTQTGVPYLYGIVPGNNLGITVNAAQGPTDIISIAYVDVNFAINCYQVSMDATGTVATFTLPTPLPVTCILPPGLAAPQALNDGVVGLKQGDLLYFQVTIGVGANATTASAIGSVSSVAPGGGPNSFIVGFAAGDVGHINQPAAAGGSLKQLAGNTSGSATRLRYITYYLDISPNDGVTPRLMRAVAGQTPTPVAENVGYLKFSYDLFNAGAVVANQNSLPAGTAPTMITKVNIAHLTMRSQAPGATGYQGLDLQTSIAARNMTFQQEYPIAGSAY